MKVDILSILEREAKDAMAEGCVERSKRLTQAGSAAAEMLRMLKRVERIERSVNREQEAGLRNGFMRDLDDLISKVSP